MILTDHITLYEVYTKTYYELKQLIIQLVFAFSFPE